MSVIDNQINQTEKLLEQLKQRKQQEQVMVQQYNPAMFSSYQQQSQQVVQQPQMQTPQPQPNLPTNANWIPVKSVDDAERIVVGQGQVRWFMMEGTQVMGHKTVNEYGLPTTTFYTFEAFDPYKASQKQEQEPTPINLDGYVKEDVVKEMQGEIETLKKEIETLKANKPQPTQSARKAVETNDK